MAYTTTTTIDSKTIGSGCVSRFFNSSDSIQAMQLLTIQQAHTEKQGLKYGTVALSDLPCNEWE